MKDPPANKIQNLVREIRTACFDWYVIVNKSTYLVTEVLGVDILGAIFDLMSQEC
jgi:hypothetical protein